MMRIILFFVVGISIPGYNLAATSERWQSNTQMLPQYCKDRIQGLDSAAFGKWRRTLGEAYIHIHHYCNGVYAEQKARSALDKRERERWLLTVVQEMQYVGRRCQARCVLYPELHTRWGWAMQARGQPVQAIEHFQLAIRSKPKYVPAYAKLSDVYVELKQPDEARRVLAEGLDAKPGSRMLQKRLRKLEAAP